MSPSRTYRIVSRSARVGSVAFGLHRLRRRQRLRVRHVELPVGLGLRLVLASDLHADWRLMPRAMIAQVVSAINSVGHSDAVLLPGDFVADDLSAIDWCAEELARIDAPTFASLGNHDLTFRTGVVRAALLAAGIHVLVNESAPLRDGVWVGGLDSAVGRPDVAAMLEGLPERRACIVLGHEPALATMHDEVLHLAGHTHHGQVRVRGLPWRYLPTYSQPFPEGSYEVIGARGRRWIYTSAGVGSTSMPLRIGAPPEIVVLDV